MDLYHYGRNKEQRSKNCNYALKRAYVGQKLLEFVERFSGVEACIYEQLQYIDFSSCLCCKKKIRNVKSKIIVMIEIMFSSTENFISNAKPFQC